MGLGHGADEAERLDVAVAKKLPEHVRACREDQLVGSEGLAFADDRGVEEVGLVSKLGKRGRQARREVVPLQAERLLVAERPHLALWMSLSSPSFLKV